MAKILVETVPEIIIVGGMVHVTRADGVCEAWPFSVFSETVGVAMRIVREFHARNAKPIRIRKRREVAH